MGHRDSPPFPLDRGRNGHGGEMSCAVGAALLRTPGLLIIPSAVDPPVRERARPPGSRWSALLDERSGRAWPGLQGLPGSMAGGMISAPQPYD